MLLGALTAGVLFVTAAHAQGVLTEDEAQCELRSQYIMGSFTRRYAKCLLKCAQHTDSRSAAAEDCPESGACSLGLANPTCRCLMRAREQAVDGQVGRCSDCPECYLSGPGPACSADADAKTETIASWAESLFFSGTPALYCDDSSSVDGLQPDEAKCQQTTAKALAFFARAKSLCHQRCRSAEHAGGTPPGSCDAPISTNPNGQAEAKGCIDQAEGRAALKIDKRCNAVGGNPPECWNGRVAADWVAEAEQLVDDQDASFFCASPSPAFLDDVEFES